jgi:hypothetical protein
MKYISNDIIDQTKFGEFIKTRGALYIHWDMLLLGILLNPGTRFLST